MKCLLTKKTAAMFTVAIAFGFGAVCQAQTFFEDFEGGTTMPSTMFFTHDGVSTATQADHQVALLPHLVFPQTVVSVDRKGLSSH